MDFLAVDFLAAEVFVAVFLAGVEVAADFFVRRPGSAPSAIDSAVPPAATAAPVTVPAAARAAAGAALGSERGSAT